MSIPPEPEPAGGGPGPAPSLAGVWDQFYDYCFAVINQCPSVRRLRDADREDCVQEVMVELVRKFGAHDPDSFQDKLTGWIRVLSRNKAADILRRRYRKPEVNFDDGSGSAVLDGGPGRAGADDDGGRGEHVSLVWEALLSLDNEVSATSYLVFYLRTIEGWTVPEVAELFQMSPEQARARCHRVKAKFGSILKTKSKARNTPAPGPAKKRRDPAGGGTVTPAS